LGWVKDERAVRTAWTQVSMLTHARCPLLSLSACPNPTSINTALPISHRARLAGEKDPEVLKGGFAGEDLVWVFRLRVLGVGVSGFGFRVVGFRVQGFGV